ncbi:MAG: 4Fe-4S dicluster domain-containing protein [Tepidisphaeraceae bacterium]
MRAAELVFRAVDPCYALIGRHGEDITFWAYVVCGVIVLGSMLVSVPFCRWFCPMAAVMSPLSAIGLTRIQRDVNTCTGCGKCARVCPMAIQVDKLIQVNVARCTSCLTCVDSCKTKTGPSLSWGPPKSIGKAWPRGALIAVLLLCGGAAVTTSYLVPIASYIKTQGTSPTQTAQLNLQVHELTCRGRANLLLSYLQREDLQRLPADTNKAPAYFKLEAWPGPGASKVRITYDPQHVTEEQLKRAITLPIYELKDNRWWPSPFKIEGYVAPLPKTAPADTSPIELPLD